MVCTHPSLLAELGRVEDVQQLAELADELEASKPRANRAIAYVRRARGAVEGPRDPLRLTRLLIRTTLDYQALYPTRRTT